MDKELKLQEAIDLVTAMVDAKLKKNKDYGYAHVCGSLETLIALFLSGHDRQHIIQLIERSIMKDQEKPKQEPKYDSVFDGLFETIANMTKP